MAVQGEIRFWHDLDTERELGVEVCPHITLANAYPETSDGYEYSSLVVIDCEECGERYTLREKIN